MEEMRPKVGLAVIVRRNGKFLLGERLNSHGAHTWSMPGGHIEFGESFEQTARREVMEEAGIELGDVRFLHATNDIFDEGKHYITIFMTATATDDPEVREPDKMIRWAWHSWDALPEPLFKPIINLIADGIRPDQG